MKNTLVLLVLASMFPLVASAQMVPSTRQVCNKRCVRIDFAGNPRVVNFEEKIRQLQEQKKNETDPVKLKALAEEEALVSEKREDYVENMCRSICRNNPEG